LAHSSKLFCRKLGRRKVEAKAFAQTATAGPIGPAVSLAATLGRESAYG
jgi:hypothetical protein